jgi:hypothetical protein
LFIERYNDYQNVEHQKMLKKNKDSELRHSANMERLYEEMERIEKENADKAFKKYCGIVKIFFFKFYLFIFYSIFIEKNKQKNRDKEKKMLEINYKKNNID